MSAKKDDVKDGGVPLGPLNTEDFQKAVSDGKKTTLEEEKKKNQVVLARDELKKSFNIIDNEKDEIVDLLKKADIKSSVYFPFKTKTNVNGELEFIPKNIFKMKKDAKKAKKQLEEALEKNKITQDEFNMLNDNLNEMLKENGLDEEKEEEKEITDEEVDSLFETFNADVNNYTDGLIAFIGEETFKKMSEDYEDMDLDERKNGLEKFNSKINQKLGIAGNIGFSTDDNLKFENSFVKGGYLVSEKDIMDNNLEDMLKQMMEKSMVRKVMFDPKCNFTMAQKKALVNKIMKEKKLSREQLLQNKSLVRKYVY